jgi:hypothetical protein
VALKSRRQISKTWIGALAGHILLQQAVERSMLSHATFGVAPTKIPTSSADVWVRQRMPQMTDVVGGAL